MSKRLTSLSIAIYFPVHTQPAGRQNRNIVSIILTFSPVMYSFMIKFYFRSPLTAFFRKLCVGSPQVSMTVIFYGQKPCRHGIFFIGNCELFHRFSTKYRLNNSTLNFKKNLCVEPLQNVTF